MAVIIPQVLTDRSGAQKIDGSLNFDGSKSQSLTRTVGNGKRTTWTWSAWVKTDPTQVNGSGGFAPMFFGGLYNTSGQQTHIAFGGSGGTAGQLLFTHYSGSSYTTNLRSTDRFRDIGWYHIVVVFDSNNGTSGDRARVYVNGERITSWSSETYPSEGGTTWINDSSKFHGIGKDDKSATENCFDGKMSQTYFIDGLALDASYFGFTDPLTNTWKPKKYTGDFNVPADTKSADGTFTSSGSQVGGPIANAYDGNTGTDGGSTSGVTFWGTSGGTSTQSGLSIAFTSNVKIFYNVNTGGGTISVNGVSKDADVPGNGNTSIGTLTWTTGDISSPFTSIAEFAPSLGVGVYISGIQVDGVFLEDISAGVNGFYLPMDGNSPIGQDKSGNGNDWNAANFSGSVALDSPAITGGRPILNTTQGGAQAAVGVFGSKENKTVTVTVASKTGGGNAYFFDSVERDSLATIRGATITFDTTDSTNNSHPFKLSSTNADSSSGTEYTDGVAYYINGSTVSGSDYVSNYLTNGGGTGFRGIKWTVPHNVSTTYYYCTVHSGMGEGGRLTSTTDETKADPYAWKVVLAVPMAGSSTDFSGSINATQTSKAFSNNAGTTYTSEFSNFYSGSGDFTTSSDVKRIDYATSGSAFGFGTDDFTIEWWMYATANADGNHYVWDTTGQKSSLIRKSGGGMTFETLGSSGAIGEVTILSSGSYNLNKWAYWAVVRDGDNVRVYIDGVLIQKTTGFSGVDFGDADGDIGGYHGGNAVYNADAHIQDFRIYKGIAKYTGTSVGTQYVTVPSRFPDVLPDTPSGATGSKLAKIIDGSVGMNVPGDEYLSIPASEDFNFGTGDFTIEGYFYVASTGSNNSLWDLRDTGSNSQYFIKMTDATTYDLRYSSSSLGSFTASAKKWNHIAISRSSATTKIFVDGVQTNSFSDSNDASNTGPLLIGTFKDTTGSSSSYGFNGFVSNFRVIKGTALYTSNFTPPLAPLTNVTNTKLLCCQSPTSAAAAAVIPTGSITANNVEVTTFNPFNTDISTVRGQETNQVTFNALNNINCTLSEGNLKFVTGGNNSTVWTTQPIPTSGKWCFESTFGGGDMAIMLDQEARRANRNVNTISTGLGMFMYYSTGSSDNRFQTNSNNTAMNSSFTTDTVGDAFMFEVDMDNGTVRVRKDDGSDSGLFTMPDALKAAPLFVGFTVTTTWPAVTQTFNFGQYPFKVSPTDGFQPLNAINLRPDKVISRPDQYVGVVTYSSNSGTAYAVTDLKFSPDLILTKNRDSNGGDWNLQDTVCGITSVLTPSQTYAASTQTDNLNAVNSNGFTVGTGARFNNGTNKICSWFWKAGGPKFGGQSANEFWIDGKNYASVTAAGLDGGSTNPAAASVNTKSKFGIYTFAGNSANRTLSHGLGQQPDFMIVKKKSAAGNSWVVWHKSIGNDKYMVLNAYNTQDTDATLFNSHASDSSTLWTLGSNTSINETGQSSVAYLWCDVPGLQKFGTFEGNTSADGPYVKLGFRPAIVLLKCVDNQANWMLYDNKRGKYNPNNFVLGPNTGDGGNTYDGYSSAYPIDFVSDGFKVRTNVTNSNTNTMIYMAWAEAPSIDLFGGVSNAR